MSIKSNTKKIITVLGAGNMGTAVAQVLADNGHEVRIWNWEGDLLPLKQIEKFGENKKYLKGVKLSKNIKPTTDLEQALKSSKFIFEVVPVSFLRSVLEEAKPFVTQEHRWCLLSKGIEQNTLMFSKDIIDDVLGFNANKVVLSGPNCASGLAAKKMTATILAGDRDDIDSIKNILQNSYFKIYTDDDIVGVQVCGALKNAVALLVGLAEGVGLGMNAKAWLATKGLREISDLSVALGGKRETAFGLAGFGDLILSIMPTGRNFQLGKVIGEGASIEEAKQTIQGSLEGINTTKSLYELIKKMNLNLPLCEGLHDVLFNGKSVSSLLSDICRV